MSVEPTAVEKAVATTLATEHGRFAMLGYRDRGGIDHVALVLGNPARVTSKRARPPLVRLHSECLTGDALGSWRCDCGEQLRAALRLIGAEGSGVLIYLRGHEGRGIGLIPKLRAYALQDEGLDTVDANLRLGLPTDTRNYAAAAAILHDLGLPRIRLLSGNPDKAAQLAALGIEVAHRVSMPVAERPENAFYMQTKRLRMGHDAALTSLDVWEDLIGGKLPTGPMTEPGAALLDRYGPLVRPGPLVIGQLAQSMDGFIASRTGDAVYVSGSEDREHLHRLRALVDAVVVGAATVRADDPQLTVRAVPGSSPARVILDPAGTLPQDRRLMDDGTAPTLWCIGPGAPAPEGVKPHVEVIRLPVGQTGSGWRSGFTPADILAELTARGLTRVLVEGGGRAVSAFLSAGLLDRLYLTTAPLLIGDGIPGIRFAGRDRLADALRAPTRRFILGSDICTEFDLAALRPAGSGETQPSQAVHDHGSRAIPAG
jgi:3,4-dihydroxy 2-butanone 4-phosphate synthase/GTP cyclohydrolase II